MLLFIFVGIHGLPFFSAFHSERFTQSEGHATEVKDLGRGLGNPIFQSSVCPQEWAPSDFLSGLAFLVNLTSFCSVLGANNNCKCFPVSFFFFFFFFGNAHCIPEE